MKKDYKLGEIYWVNLTGQGSIQRGWHPAVIMQNNAGNKFSETIAVVPITSAKKSKLPTHVIISAGSFGLKKTSTIQCEGQQLIIKDNIGNYIGKVDKQTMGKISKCCLINTPYLMFLNDEEITKVKKENSKIGENKVS